MSNFTLFILYLFIWYCSFYFITCRDVKPHFQIDHEAGKLAISATPVSADIVFGNDKIDLLLKPGDTAVPFINKVVHAKHEIPDNTTQNDEVKNMHDNVDDRSLNFDNLTKHNSNSNTTVLEGDLHNENIEKSTNPRGKTSNVTWIGTLNHTEERSISSVLKTLDEIKSLMSQTSSKVDNNAKFGSTDTKSEERDEYLDAANAIIKKVEQQQGASISKFDENNPEDTDYVKKAQEILNKYKELDKKGASAKLVDEGIGDSVDKYDITGLSNNISESMPNSQLQINHNNTKNSLDNRNSTIKPLEIQKLYELNKIIDRISPQLFHAKQTVHAPLNENATQSENDADSAVHIKNNGTTKLNEEVKVHSAHTPNESSLNETYANLYQRNISHFVNNAILDSKTNRNASKTNAENINAISREYNEKLNSKYQYEFDSAEPTKLKSSNLKENTLDLTDPAEKAYASIDIDPDAVNEKLEQMKEEKKVQTAERFQDKKNSKEEDVYSTIDNNLTRNITKQEMGNEVANQTTQEEDKEWIKYVYHEKQADEKKLRENHMKKLVAWAPARAVSKETEWEKPTRRVHFSSAFHKNQDEKMDETDSRVGIHNKKAEEFFRTQEDIEKCESNIKCQTKSEIKKQKYRKAEKVKLEGNVETVATAENEKETPTTSAKKLSSDTAKETNATGYSEAETQSTDNEKVSDHKTKEKEEKLEAKAEMNLKKIKNEEADLTQEAKQNLENNWNIKVSNKTEHREQLKQSQRIQLLGENKSGGNVGGRRNGDGVKSASIKDEDKETILAKSNSKNLSPDYNADNHDDIDETNGHYVRYPENAREHQVRHDREDNRLEPGGYHGSIGGHEKNPNEGYSDNHKEINSQEQRNSHNHKDEDGEVREDGYEKSHRVSHVDAHGGNHSEGHSKRYGDDYREGLKKDRSEKYSEEHEASRAETNKVGHVGVYSKGQSENHGVDHGEGHEDGYRKERGEGHREGHVQDHGQSHRLEEHEPNEHNKSQLSNGQHEQSEDYHFKGAVDTIEKNLTKTERFEKNEKHQNFISEAQSNENPPKNMADESTDNSKLPVKSINSFLSNGEESVEETYGSSREKYNEGRSWEQINKFGSKQSDEDFRRKEENKKSQQNVDDKNYNVKDLEGMITLERQDSGKGTNESKKKKLGSKKKYGQKKAKLKNINRKKHYSGQKKHLSEKTKSEKTQKPKTKEMLQKKKDNLFSLSYQEAKDAEQVLKTLDDTPLRSFHDTSSFPVGKGIASITVNAPGGSIQVVQQPKLLPRPQLQQYVHPQAFPSQQETPSENNVVGTQETQPSQPSVTIDVQKSDKTEEKVNETSDDVFPAIKENSTVGNTNKQPEEEFDFAQLDPDIVTENHLDLSKPYPSLGLFPALLRKELKNQNIDGPSLQKIEKLKKDRRKQFLLELYVKQKTLEKGMNKADTQNEAKETLDKPSIANSQQRDKDSKTEQDNKNKGQEQSTNNLTDDVSKAMEELEALMKEKTDEINKTVNENHEAANNENSLEHKIAETVLNELNKDETEKHSPSDLHFIDPHHMKSLEDDPTKALALFRRNSTDGYENEFDNYSEKYENKAQSIVRHKTSINRRKSQKKDKQKQKFHKQGLEKKKSIPSEKNIEEMLNEAGNYKLEEEMKLNKAKISDDKKQEQIIEHTLAKYTQATNMLKKQLRELRANNRGNTGKMNETSDDFYNKNVTGNALDNSQLELNTNNETIESGLKETNSVVTTQTAQAESNEHSAQNVSQTQNLSQYSQNGDETISAEQPLTNYLIGKTSESNTINETSEETYNVNKNETSENETLNLESNASRNSTNYLKKGDRDLDKEDKEVNEVNKEIDNMSEEISKIEERKEKETALSWKDDGTMKSNTNTHNETLNSNATTNETIISSRDEKNTLNEKEEKEKVGNEKESSEVTKATEESNTNISAKTPEDEKNIPKNENTQSAEEKEKQTADEKGKEMADNDNKLLADEEENKTQTDIVTTNQLKTTEEESLRENLISNSESSDQKSVSSSLNTDQLDSSNLSTGQLASSSLNADQSMKKVGQVEVQTEQPSNVLETGSSQKTNDLKAGNSDQTLVQQFTSEQPYTQLEMGNQESDSRSRDTKIENEQSEKQVHQKSMNKDIKEESKKTEKVGEEKKKKEKKIYKEKSRNNERYEIKEGSTLVGNQQIVDGGIDKSDQTIISQLVDGKSEKPSDLIKEIKADFDQQEQMDEDMKEYTEKERQAAEKALEDMNKLAQGDYFMEKEKDSQQNKHDDEKQEASTLNEQEIKQRLENEQTLSQDTSNSDNDTPNNDKGDDEKTKINNEETEHHHSNSVNYYNKDDNVRPTESIIPKKERHKNDDEEAQQENQSRKNSKESTVSTHTLLKRKGNSNEKNTNSHEENNKSKEEDIFNLEELAKHFKNNDLENLFANATTTETSSDEKVLQAATDAILSSNSLLKNIKGNVSTTISAQTTVDPYSTFKRSIHKFKKRKYFKKRDG